MYRALAVLSAAASLALGPAASAATHTSSHKPAHGASAHEKAAHGKAAHGKSGHAEAEAPAKGRKAHGGKAVASAKHRHGADEAADAAPTKRGSKRHGKAAPVEEASDETASKTSRSKHHGVEAVETETKVSLRHSTHQWAEETESVGHAGLKSTKACVASHTRAHGRPRSAKARAALQRECVKEVEAARRKAEEEAAIRNWSAPRGPLIYPGAMPRTAAAAPEPETPANPVPPPAAPASADATPAVGGAASVSTASGTISGAPTEGAAVVQQQLAQPPEPSGLFGGLFHGRRGPQRAPGAPAPTLASLMGSDETRLKTELGEPELMRAEGDGALWTYRLQGCALYVFLGRDAASGPWKVKGAQAGPLKRGGSTPDVDVCLKGSHS